MCIETIVGTCSIQHIGCDKEEIGGRASRIAEGSLATSCTGLRRLHRSISGDERTQGRQHPESGVSIAAILRDVAKVYR